MLYGEVYAMAQSGRHTIDELVYLVRSRGYVISPSAMHRFMQRVQGAEGVIRRWLASHPTQAVKLAELLAKTPGIDFGAVMDATSE